MQGRGNYFLNPASEPNIFPIVHLRNESSMKEIKIVVAGTGYVGLSMATLLAQHNQVVAVDIVPEKVEKINVVIMCLPKGITMNKFFQMNSFSVT